MNADSGGREPLGKCRFTILGRTYELKTNDSDLLQAVSRKFAAHLMDRSAGSPCSVSITRMGEECVVSLGQRSARLRLQGHWPKVDDLFSLLILRHNPECMFVHASAVGSRAGAALFVGPSGCGKTTLALALEQEGFTLLADDLVPVHPAEGSVASLVLAPEIRSRTLEMGVGLRWTSAGHGPEKSEALAEHYPLRSVFFMVPETCRAEESSSTRFADAVGPEAVAEWRAMLTLVFGPVGSERAIGGTACITIEPASFERNAAVAEIGKGAALRQLLNHTWMLTGRFQDWLSRGGQLLQNAECCELQPGELQSSVRLVKERLL